MHLKALSLALVAAGLAGCGTRSDGSINAVAGATPALAQPAKDIEKSPGSILVTDSDISDRHYRSLGDISVTVSKWTIFDADPTPAKVNEALQEQAAKLGADAVILVRYGTVGMGMFTWGKLDGNGRAIAFEP
jgi:hypothetical protein